jgi:predicted transcriptional regulator
MLRCIRDGEPTPDWSRMTEAVDPSLIATAQIVAAWLRSHQAEAASIPELIRDVHSSLTNPDPERRSQHKTRVRAVPKSIPRSVDDPAVDIRKSVFADHLICLEDGKSFKTLTRHLNETHGMTPQQYRAKWDLPEAYPMMAPDYSIIRSGLSKIFGGGKRR